MSEVGELSRVKNRESFKEDRQALEIAQESIKQLQREHKNTLERYENLRQQNESNIKINLGYVDK